MDTFKKIRIIGVAAALSVGLLVAGAAEASYGTVIAKVDSKSPSGAGGGIFSFTRQGLPNTVAGGTFAQALVSDSPVGKFIGICLDIDDGISVPSGVITWNVEDLEAAPDNDGGGDVDPMGANATALRKLVGGVLGSLSNAAAVLTNDGLKTSFQLAVWEIVNERSGTYLTGGGTYAGTFDTQANTWLGLLGTYSEAKNLFALVSGPGLPNTQDFMVEVVPIPAAAWLLGSGLLGLFGLARRKKGAA